VVPPLLLAWIVLLAGVGPAFAQPVEDAGPGTTVAAVPPQTPPSRIGTLRRIIRGLETLPPASSGASLRVNVELEVFGVAPRPTWLDQADLVIGAPTYGAPTHDDLLTALTPSPLRSTAPYRRLRSAWPLKR